MNPFGELISTYSRFQAIEDGVLVDISAVAREVGIRFPVAMTRAAWAATVPVPRNTECQDEAGRLWDVVWLLRCVIRASATIGETLRCAVRVRVGRRLRIVWLKAVCGPGDDAEPVITVMLPDED
jgi:hypothetical protein